MFKQSVQTEEVLPEKYSLRNPKTWANDIRDDKPNTEKTQIERFQVVRRQVAHT